MNEAPDSSDAMSEGEIQSDASSDDEYMRPSKRLLDIENEHLGNDTDSETEALQDAFAKGILKPGLNIIAPEKKKEFVNNIPMLRQRLIELSNNLDWVERLDLISKPASLPPELALQLAEAEKQNKVFDYDELKHESVFYRQAQDAVLTGIPKLHSLGIPTRRPEDYFAEMSKSDEHMQKVKSMLIKKKAVTERVERGRQLRQQRKLQKALQAQSRANKQNAIKEHHDEIAKFRKGKRKDLEFLDSKPNKKQTKSQLKRNYRDTKFGFGGKKRGAKNNTRESTMGEEGPRKRRVGQGTQPNKKNKKKIRLGKSRRNNMKKSK